ncbi:mediator of rna polymerase ii transcription subunit 6 [Stylonychia lemnae]|uniref:Mediator of RNA polymerase II transcription subunit 6 n=1 Tax=Stylonychia lemnae TaxID=5949 RepID=A0A078B805_STYLE|nr:mediator of rna polymerase ii transcription subunit 6 [Stylonychia lemnae]|eukprot:CDW89392.1 mediator of rna polymerase ii transcription subunit 6 [Stylonychia lemnae]
MSLLVQHQLLQQKKEYKDLEHIQFILPEFLNDFSRITKDISLDYFYYSPFYDKESNNEKLKCQQQQQSLDKLKEHQGIEFVQTFYDDEQGVYLIEKRYRKSPLETFTISAYFIVFDRIFQASTLKKIIDARSQNAAYFIDIAFEEAKQKANILYSKTSRPWKHQNQNDERIDYDMVFQNAQQELEQVYSEIFAQNKTQDSTFDMNRIWAESMQQFDKNFQ